MKKLISRKHFRYKLTNQILETNISRELSKVLRKLYNSSLTANEVGYYKDYAIYCSYALDFSSDTQLKHIAGSNDTLKSHTSIRQMSKEDIYAIMKMARIYYTKLMHKHIVNIVKQSKLL